MNHREPAPLVAAYPGTTTAVHRLEIIVKLKGPIVTLVAGAALAAGLVGADLAVTDDTATTVAASEAAATSTTASSATASSATASSATASSATGTSATATSRAAEAPPPGTSTAPPGAPASRSAGAVTYAGKVDGGGSLSVVVKAGSAVGYLCDGKSESWLWGVLDGSRVLLANPTGDRLTGAHGGGRISGTVDVGGARRTFTLPRVAKPSGLYRAAARVRGASVVGGWIVLPDGTQVGVLRRDGRPVPAPALDAATGAVTVDGTRITATEPDPTNHTGR